MLKLRDNFIAKFGSALNFVLAGALAYGVSKHWWTEEQAFAYGGAITMATGGAIVAAKYGSKNV